MKIGVIGTGTMGCGIAVVAAIHGFPTILVSRTKEGAKGGLEKIERLLTKNLDRGKIVVGEKEDALRRIVSTADVRLVADCGLVIEAIVENVSLKQELFRSLGVICSESAVLASNTSSIPIRYLASAVTNPGRVVGMHFMNPALIMPLVEVVRGPTTSDTTIEVITKTAKALGKEPIVVRDSPGFVCNRLLMGIINEAFCVLQERVATREAIDSIAKLGLKHPMGPFELADLIGLDVCVDILDVMERELGGKRYKACALLRDLVAQGRLGRKTGKGVYDYSRRT